MVCENCEDIRNVDGSEPDCETEKGCKIPRLDKDGARVMRLRSELYILGPLIGPETVLGMHGATREDIELLLVVEHEMKRLKSND